MEGRTLHADCFRCTDCGAQLEGGCYQAPSTNPFRKSGEEFRCPTCHTLAVQQREDLGEARSVAEEARRKQAEAAKYRLSWRPELTPCPRRALRELGVADIPPGPGAGLVCVCLDEATGSVGVGPVPAAHAEAAVSLPYLACALRVLRDYRREPQFSLDPKDPHDLSGPFLVKKFYPDWLAGTVMGEVLFQADYALKEICFGDKRLPGIPSAFDDEERPGRRADEPSAARQWFTVRRAAVTVAADGALVPHVEMGVEARRLTHGPKGYVDAPYTDPNDPWSRQAAAVTARFNEVAAALPVVGQLMQVARATVLAVHLLGRGCKCNDTALDRYRIPEVPEGSDYPIQIPTLVKDRRKATVEARPTGRGSEVIVHRQSRSMRGGVDLAVPNGRKVPTRAVAARLMDAGTRPALLPLFLAPAVGAAAARAA